MDRGFPSIQSPVIGGTDESASHDDLARTASLDLTSPMGRLGQFEETSFFRGFMDELEKSE